MLTVLCLSSPGHAVIPKYYYVPADFVEAEQNKHGSQKRFPSNSGRDGKIFLWGQALYNIAKLLGMPLTVFMCVCVCALWFPLTHALTLLRLMSSCKLNSNKN